MPQGSHQPVGPFARKDQLRRSPQSACYAPERRPLYTATRFAAKLILTQPPLPNLEAELESSATRFPVKITWHDASSAQPLPLMATPSSPAPNSMFFDWVRDNRSEILSRLTVFGALLFRDFRFESI